MRRAAPGGCSRGCNYTYSNGVGPAVLLEGFLQRFRFVEIVRGALGWCRPPVLLNQITLGSVVPSGVCPSRAITGALVRRALADPRFDRPRDPFADADERSEA